MSTPRKPDASAFRDVSDMETPLGSIYDLFLGVSLLVETMDDEKGSVIQTLTLLGMAECRKAQKLQEKLFHLTNSNRAPVAGDRS